MLNGGCRITLHGRSPGPRRLRAAAFDERDRHDALHDGRHGALITSLAVARWPATTVACLKLALAKKTITRV